MANQAGNGLPVRDRTQTGANLGFEAELWRAADALRSNMDAAEYKHVVLGLVFLKYISDAFEERHAFLAKAIDDPENEYYLKPDVPNRSDAVLALLEDRDEYIAKNIFWVPKEARWSNLKANAKQPTVGKVVDDAMLAIERDNPSLKGVLPKDYAHPRLDKQRLGQLIDMVDCMVALPGQLFYSTQIPVCLWFLSRDKSGRPPSPQPSPSGRGSRKAGEGYRDRRGEVLFIDARKLGTMIDRVHRDLTDADIRKIADTYHAWRSPAEALAKADAAPYENVPGFCKVATLDDIRHHGHILTPGRYVGAAEVEDDGEPFEAKMARLTAELREQTTKATKLDKMIWANLKDLGYEIE